MDSDAIREDVDLQTDRHTRRINVAFLSPWNKNKTACSSDVCLFSVDLHLFLVLMLLCCRHECAYSFLSSYTSCLHCFTFYLIEYVTPKISGKYTFCENTVLFYSLKMT